MSNLEIDYDDYYGSGQDFHRRERATRTLLGTVLRRFPPPSRASALDAGCGTGYYAHMLSSEFGFDKVVGSDTSEEALVRARARFGDGITWTSEDVFTSHDDDAFDLILSSEFYPYSAAKSNDDARNVTTTLARRLRRGGRLIFKTTSRLDESRLKTSGWRQFSIPSVKEIVDSPLTNLDAIYVTHNAILQFLGPIGLSAPISRLTRNGIRFHRRRGIVVAVATRAGQP